MSSEASVARLLEAEQAATKIVTSARNRRKEKLKQAKEEAKKEAELFKQSKLSEFTKFKETHLSGTTKQQQELNAKTSNDIAAIKKSIADNEAAVVQLLINALITIEDPFDGLDEGQH